MFYICFRLKQELQSIYFRLALRRYNVMFHSPFIFFKSVQDSPVLFLTVDEFESKLLPPLIGNQTTHLSFLKVYFDCDSLPLSFLRELLNFFKQYGLSLLKV